LTVAGSEAVGAAGGLCVHDVAAMTGTPKTTKQIDFKRSNFVMEPSPQTSEFSCADACDNK
jgi:hypothetical protein